MTKQLQRCPWLGEGDEQYTAYHDQEWGRPVHDERLLFEMLTLEGAQAGLSWLTVLRKRERYREVFANFDVKKIARFTDKDIERLMLDPGIIRNRLKINSVIGNAKAVLALNAAGQTLDNFLWQFVNHQTIVRRPRSISEYYSKDEHSAAMSKALLMLGFKFVGSTICYAFMQATGMIDEHSANCYLGKKTR